MTVVVVTSGPACPLSPLEMMRRHTGESEDAFVFRGFRGLKKSPERTSSGNECITYAQFSTSLALWLGGVMGIHTTEFLSRYGSQSSRGGGALAASNAGIPFKLWAGAAR